MSERAAGSYEQAIFDAGFEKTSFSHQGATRDVYRMGEGPPVILLSEMPGITPPTLELAARLKAAGYSVVMPQLFGEPGRPLSIGPTVRELAKACVSREFTVLARKQASPITEWLRALARDLHRQHQGRGVGVIGMCFTGGFALAMMVDDAVMAPVLSQPSLPFPIGSRKTALGLSDADLARVKDRCAREDLKVLGLRFTADRAVPKERFDELRKELGDRFIAVEIDSSLFNPHGNKPWAHSVLTSDFIDRPGHPTRAALEQVLALFARQLRA